MRFTFQLCFGMQAMSLGLSPSVNKIRCTARLLIRELEDPRSLVTNCIDEICKLFEGGQFFW